MQHLYTINRLRSAGMLMISLEQLHRKVLRRKRTSRLSLPGSTPLAALQAFQLRLLIILDGADKDPQAKEHHRRASQHRRNCVLGDSQHCGVARQQRQRGCTASMLWTSVVGCHHHAVVQSCQEAAADAFIGMLCGMHAQGAPHKHFTLDAALGFLMQCSLVQRRAMELASLRQQGQDLRWPHQWCRRGGRGQAMKQLQGR